MEPLSIVRIDLHDSGSASTLVQVNVTFPDGRVERHILSTKTTLAIDVTPSAALVRYENK